MKITGNKILLTGATSGIGLELAKKLLELDNRVIGLGRHTEKLESLGQSGKLFIEPCHLGRPEAIQQTVARIRQEHADVNVLINNAGIQLNYDLLRDAIDPAQLAEEIQVNLTAPAQLATALLPLLLANKDAGIINITTGLALAPKRSAPTYCASKAGLHSFTRTLRYQLENTGVKVVEVLPPLVDTNMTKGRGKDKVSAGYVVQQIIRGMQYDREEIVIGKVRLLKHIWRLSPALAYRIMKNG